MKAKILTLLGFAAKSGNLSYGFSAAKEALNRKKAKLILISSDISEKSKKEIIFTANQSNISFLTLDDTDIFELSNAVGHKCGIISVNENGFAKAIKEEILNDQ